ncbi:MAG: arabinofuranosidase catalytic domain-containing protein [Sphingobacteriaceae bacterium]
MKRNLLALIAILFVVNLNSQVSYGSAALYGLRKLNTTYTSSAIQVRRACDNATANIGFTSCGDLDTTTLKNFVLVPNPLSAIAIASEGAYSLRKLRCAYNGNAINVRRTCDDATKDIGFTALGDLDTIALKTFVMASNPLSALSVNAGVAYGLRKLRCAYVGPAINVRRSSDSFTSNIGFTTNGDLDTATLKTFVGAGNGFVTIWYDQSGNGINISPPANTNQPRIITAGAVLRKNNQPTITFDGVDDYFTTNAFSTAGYTGFTSNILASWTTVGASIANIQALLDNDHNCTRVFVIQDRPDLVNKPVTIGMPNVPSCNTVNDGLTTGNGTMRILTYVNNTTTETGYRNGTSYGSQAYAGAYVIGTRFMVGAWYNAATVSRFLSGSISEVIIFKSALSNTDRQYLEWGQSQYYSVTGPVLSSSLPASVPSAFVATWYDQSGNARNATQAANALQPRIINAGLIEKNSTNRPSIYFNATYLKNAFFLTTQPVSTSFVFRARGLANPGGELFGWGNNSGGGRRYGGWFNFTSASQGQLGVENQGAAIVGSALLNTNTWYIASQILPNSSLPTLTQWINGTSQAMTNIGAPAAMNIIAGEFAIGTIPTANVQGINGDIQELVYFSSALSAANRQYIEWSQSQYYGISGPVLATLPGSAPSASVATWYDQSGNGNNLQSTGSRQPLIVNAGVIRRLGLAGTWPTIQGTSASQTNLTTIFGSAYTGAALTVNSVFRTDINTNANLRIVSVGNAALTSADWNSNNYFNINQRNTNDFVVERNGITPVVTGITVGSAMVLSDRFSGGFRQMFYNGNGSTATVDNAAFNFSSMRLLQSINPAFEATEAMTGKMSEFGLYYASLSTTRRRLIESNQAAYYNITISNSKYTPPSSTTYNRFVVGIGREAAASGDSVAVTRQSSGMGFSVTATAAGFLKDDGDYISAGINCAITNSTNTTFLASAAPVVLRWDNDWYIDKRDVGTPGGIISIYFDFGDYNIGTSPGVASNYSLLARGSTVSNFTVVTTAIASVAGDRVIFAMNANAIPANSSGTGYYTIGTTNPLASPLPVELISFKAEVCENNVCLNWKTASELNNDYFSVERSGDAVNWNELKRVKGAGNSQRTLDYSTMDYEPLPGISYYRLKQTDYDRNFKYSKIESVVFANTSNVGIYPNPNNGALNLNNCKAYDKLTITDVLGRKVYSAEVQKDSMQLDLNMLDNGSYFIVLSNSVNGKKFTSKIIIDKE